jgi:hypothetical protein
MDLPNCIWNFLDGIHLDKILDSPLVATKWISVKNHRVNFVYFFMVVCILSTQACTYIIYIVLV